MITAPYLKTMASYNRWQNETLFTLCEELGSDRLQTNRGMFFGSIFNTLNHILHVDETIYTFIHTKTLPPFDPNVIPYPDFNGLKVARYTLDETLIRESDLCSQEWLEEIFEFWSERLNRFRNVPRSFYYLQLFNHQTHHRSQITSELHKMGIDYGNTDLPYNPYCEF